MTFFLVSCKILGDDSAVHTYCGFYYEATVCNDNTRRKYRFITFSRYTDSVILLRLMSNMPKLPCRTCVAGYEFN